MKKNKYLDISTQGKCGDNSLDFYDVPLDSEAKKLFDSLLIK